MNSDNDWLSHFSQIIFVSVLATSIVNDVEPPRYLTSTKKKQKGKEMLSKESHRS